MGVYYVLKSYYFERNGKVNLFISSIFRVVFDKERERDDMII